MGLYQYILNNITTHKFLFNDFSTVAVTLWKLYTKILSFATEELERNEIKQILNYDERYVCQQRRHSSHQE